MIKLAELYFEDAKYAYNQEDEEFSRQLELFEAKKIGKEPDAPTLNLEPTIKLYETLLKRFPKFEQNDGVQYLYNNKPNKLKNISYDYDNSSQSFKLRFIYENKKVMIPITCRTRQAGGWSGKSLFITTSGVKFI